MRNILALLQRRVVYRTAIAVYILCVVGIISAYFSVSHRQVRYAAYFQGPEVIETQRDNAFRGMLLYAPTGEYLANSTAELTLVGPHSGESSSAINPVPLPRHSMSAIDVSSGNLFHGVFRPPALESSGKYSLEVRVQEGGETRIIASQAVRVDDHADIAETIDETWPLHQSRRQRDDIESQDTDYRDDDKREESEIRLDIIPTHGEVVRGLPNVVYLRTYLTETGEPISTTISFDEIKGVNEREFVTTLKTDKLGLARLEFVPITDQEWHLRIGDDSTVYTRELSTVAAQFSIQIAQPAVEVGSAIEGFVYSLYQSGGFFVDLYDGTHWLNAAVFGLRDNQSGFRMTLPVTQSSKPHLYRVQIYQSLYHQGRAWDVGYVVGIPAGDRAEREKRAFEYLIELHALHNPDAKHYYQWLSERFGDAEFRAAARDYRYWNEALLAALPREFIAPNILINTQQADREAMENWRKSAQKKLMYYAYGLFGLGFLFLAYAIGLGILRSREQARIFREVEDDTIGPLGDDDFDEEHYFRQQHAADMQQVAVVIQGGLIIITVILFAVGMLLLLSLL